MHSSKPAAGIVVSELCPAVAGELGTARRLNQAGTEAVNAAAVEIARHVDRLLGTRRDSSRGKAADDGPAAQENAPGVATCSCGSGIPVKVLEIDGRKVEILALPLILEMFREAGKPAIDETAAEMLETVRLYNEIPEGEDASWKLALDREYASYCAEGG
jgi:hypothetical protein